MKVENELAPEEVLKLEKGFRYRIVEPCITLPAKTRVSRMPDWPPERYPPVRFRKAIPTSWLELTLMEGKNRQVRKMRVAAGFPTLRLIRLKIENIDLTGFQAGETRELDKATIYKMLNIQ